MSGPDSAPDPGRDAGQQASVFDQGEHAGSTPAGAAAPGSEGAEVEALARAGISLAAGVATLGVRAAGRAAAALRDAVERR
jgi:hypothetical protein